jgi:hypothetical protein
MMTQTIKISLCAQETFPYRSTYVNQIVISTGANYQLAYINLFFYPIF